MTVSDQLALAQQFVVNHLKPDSFKPGGQRANSLYRDLDITDATNGAAKAHVVRNIGPFDKSKVGNVHCHNLEFHFIYMLKGWIRMRVEGQGEIVVREGTAWLQPPGIKHEVLEYSDDRELLEIVMPHDFTTTEFDEVDTATAD